MCGRVGLMGKGIWLMAQMVRSGLVLASMIAGMAVAGPAMADVKAGVDAWTAGDYATAVREWSGPAVRGDADAQFNLAQAYRLGHGVERDMAQAEALYAKAAAQGHVRAADNYGLILFQDGRREQALPYIQAAAGRGDPRAQYLLGIAHFNGDLVAQDWRRAYALVTLANATGLPQAGPVLTQMDEHIPLADRQAAQVLAAQMKRDAEATRARELAAIDLAVGADSVTSPVAVSRPVAPPPAAPPRVATSRDSAGADYTRPRQAAPPPAAPVSVKPAVQPTLTPKPAPTPVVAHVQANGPWKLQLGAFGVAGNADRLWAQLSSRRELAGREKIKLASGKLTRLLAGGFVSRAEAEAACASLKASGQACIVTQ